MHSHVFNLVNEMTRGSDLYLGRRWTNILLRTCIARPWRLSGLPDGVGESLLPRVRSVDRANGAARRVGLAMFAEEERRRA